MGREQRAKGGHASGRDLFVDADLGVVEVATEQPQWMRAMEIQLSALTLVDKLIAAKITTQPYNGWLVDKAILTAASPFAWSSEAIDAVMQASKSIPLDTRMNKWNLATPTVWWHFEKPLPFRTVNVKVDMGIRAMGFGWLRTMLQGARLRMEFSPDGNTPGADYGMPVHTWLDAPPHYIQHSVFGHTPVIPSQTWEWEKDQTLAEMLAATRRHHDKMYGPGGEFAKTPQVPIDVFMAATEGLSRFILAGLAWLNQRVLVTAETHIERHRRKDYVRKLGRTPEVRVVQLRKHTYTSHDDASSESTREFSCRWAVDGHWRNQAVGPKHGDRKLTYVMPYVKGPDDKPFRASPKKVYQVNR